MSKTRTIRVRRSEARDSEAMAELHRLRHPTLRAPTATELDMRRAVFPEGQIVAESGGRLLGFAAALVVAWERHLADLRWGGITGDGTFSTHDGEGRTLFVADLTTVPGWLGPAAARALQRALRQLCRGLRLRRIITTSSLPGYERIRQFMPPEEYAMRVAWNDNEDAELTPQLSRGYRYCGIIRGFHAVEEPSCGHAALLAWPNPAYRVRGPRRQPLRKAPAYAVPAPGP